MKKYITVIFIFMCTNAHAILITDGLVSYYQFNGDTATSAQDSQGANDGVFVNGATNEYTQANFQESLYVDGISQFFEVDDSASLNFDVALTIIAWIKPVSTTSPFQGIVVKGSSNDPNFFQYGYGVSYETIRPAVQTDSSIGVFNSDPIVETNVWQQVAITYDTTNHQLTTYKNSALDNYSMSISVPGNTIALSDFSLLIGAALPGGNYFNGNIDEVKLYNRVLTSNEILEDYDYVLNELGTPIPEPSSLLLIIVSCCSVALKKHTRTLRD